MNGDEKIEVRREGKTVAKWEGSAHSSFLLRDGVLYYANYPDRQDAPIVVRRLKLDSGEDREIETLPAWSGKNKAYHQALWLSVEEGGIVAYRYSSTHGTKVKRLAGQGAMSGPVFQPGERRWIALCAPGLVETIQPLAEKRRAEGYQVEVLTATKESFPGLKKRMAEMTEKPRLGDCVVLVGSAHPVNGGGQECVLDLGQGTRGRVKGQRSDSILGLAADSGLPVLAVGRLPAESSEDLTRMIAKIDAFEKAPVSSKLSLIAGNPLPGEATSKVANQFFNSQTEDLLSGVAAGWQRSGAADVEGNRFAVKHSDFHAAVEREMAGDWRVMAAFGHSSPVGFTSGKDLSLTKEMWRELPANPARGIFFTCGCYAMATQTSYGVTSVLAQGGPVASMGARGETYSAIGYLAGGGLRDCLVNEDGPGTLGEWWLTVQQGIAWGAIPTLKFLALDQGDGTGGKVPLKEQRLEHLEMWSLMGDPATRVRKEREP